MTTLIGFAIHKTIGMRVSEADERSGIDVTEHAETAYELLMVGGSFHPGDQHARTDAGRRPRPTPEAHAQPEGETAGKAARGRVLVMKLVDGHRAAGAGDTVSAGPGKVPESTA